MKIPSNFAKTWFIASFLFVSLVTNQALAQSLDEGTRTKIRVKFQVAEDFYEQGEHEKSNAKLDEIRQILGGRSIATTLNLRIKNQVAMKQWSDAQTSLDKLYQMSPPDSIISDIASYEPVITQNIEEQKRKQAENRRIYESLVEDYNIAITANTIEGYDEFLSIYSQKGRIFTEEWEGAKTIREKRDELEREKTNNRKAYIRNKLPEIQQLAIKVSQGYPGHSFRNKFSDQESTILESSLRFNLKLSQAGECVFTANQYLKFQYRTNLDYSTGALSKKYYTLTQQETNRTEAIFPLSLSKATVSVSDLYGVMINTYPQELFATYHNMTRTRGDPFSFSKNKSDFRVHPEAVRNDRGYINEVRQLFTMIAETCAIEAEISEF